MTKERGQGPLDRERCTDAELLKEAAVDADAFGEFYDRHARSVVTFFMRRTASADVAAELTAETFAKAFASRRQFRDLGTPARAWLHGIAHNELKKWLRRGRIDRAARRKLGLPRVELDDDSIDRIEALVDFAPLRREIRRALLNLSPSVREALVLRIGLDLPYRQVAVRLGCSEAAARVRVARGLGQLSDLMEATR